MLGCACAVGLTVNAAETKKEAKLTDEQKKEKKELLAKYDTNKDGKIDKDERAKMSKEDKEKWAELSGHRKGDDSKNKKDDAKTTK